MRPEDWDELDEEIDQLIEEFARAEADAVDVLREALPPGARAELPAEDLADAAERLRGGLLSGYYPYETIRRAAGFELPLPADDRELWLRAAGALVSPREETGLEAEEEAMLLSLELADWVGAVIGLARAGAGAPAEPSDLAGYVDDCPEISGPPLEPDDVAFIETAFIFVLSAWTAVGAIEDDRLTALGAWGLPHALALAWGHDLDEEGR